MKRFPPYSLLIHSLKTFLFGGKTREDQQLFSPLLFPELYSQSASGFLVIAHRGASYYAPENTLASFKIAHEMKADMIELDILLTKDHVPVVMHYPDLAMRSTGKGQVSSINYSELKKIDAGGWFSEEFKGETIPTLEEVLEWASGKISLNIEIKPEAFIEKSKSSAEQQVVDLVHKYKMEKHVLISSFEYKSIMRMKLLAPNIATGLLYDISDDIQGSPVRLMNLTQADTFHINQRTINNKWLNQCKENNIPTLVYTVNNRRHMLNLIRNGVTGIFTDRPDVLRNTALENF